MMARLSEIEVVYHGNKFTVFMPGQPGVDVHILRGVNRMRCEYHKHGYCIHLRAATRESMRLAEQEVIDIYAPTASLLHRGL